MTETYAELARRLIEEGSEASQITNFALLAIADQMRAANDIAVINTLIGLGLATPNAPSDGDLRNVREHLYKTLGWEDLSPGDPDAE